MLKFSSLQQKEFDQPYSTILLEFDTRDVQTFVKLFPRTLLILVARPLSH
jgi:hypothetical protein